MGCHLLVPSVYKAVRMVNENQQSTNTGKTINYAVNKENNTLILKKNYESFMEKQKKKTKKSFAMRQLILHSLCLVLSR